MKRSLILIASLLAFSLSALAAPMFHAVTESDPGGPDNLVLSSFDSLTDLKNFNTSGSSPLPSLAGAVSLKGLAFDGNQYHIITESDPGGANNLNLFSFDSLTDLKNFTVAGSSPLPSLAGVVSLAGLTFDGIQYHIITESDPGGVNNLNLFSFDSLTDLKNFAVADTSPLPSLAGAVSLAGLTFDGIQYHISTESDPGGANNLNLFSFDSLTDLKNFTVAGSSPLPSLPAAVSFGGLMFVPDTPPVAVPEPETLLLFGFGLAGLVFARRRTRTQHGPSQSAVRSTS